MTINPYARIALPELVDLVGGYSGRGLKDPKVVGYRIENLPDNESKMVISAGVPLKEVKVHS